ncbi:zinc finger protein [Zea mays]|uniref:Zinc finger protein n=1 Tax=Zea mays TaxID=4577 RepID=A0A1D6P6Y8_MAIZE|nr:zinc finger protein [Zea mays]
MMVGGGIGTLNGVSRGRGPSQGGGRGGSPMYHPLIWNAGITSPRGRGRGRGRGSGRGRRNKSSDRQLAIQASGGSFALQAQPETVCAPAHMVQATTSSSTRGTVVPAAWCDICHVGCNSKEILEQHKNGKRHKRSVQRMQDMARLQGTTPAIADMGAPSSSQLAEVEGPSRSVHMVPPLGSTSLSGEHKDLAPENVGASVYGVQITEVPGSSSKQNKTHHTSTVGHGVEAQVELHVAVQACQPSNEMKDGGEAPPNATGPSNAQLVEARMGVNGNNNGSKRKPTGAGRGRKKLRVSQAPQQRRPERVREQPLVCTICNAICDTRAVFDIHLVGKKHQSRLKRSQGPDVLFGPLVGHIPPNQSAAHMTGAPEPLYFGFKSMGASLVEQEAYLAGAMQHVLPVLPQAGPTIMAADYPAQPVASNRCC